MALSKDRTLDRLEHISKSFESKGNDCFDEYVVEAADSAIALINSTDVAEVEKLRARVLELEAERDAIRKDLEITSKSRDEAVAEVEKRLSETNRTMASEFGEPVAWKSSATFKDEIRFHVRKPNSVDRDGNPMSPGGWAAAPSLGTPVPTPGVIIPLFAGHCETIS